MSDISITNFRSNIFEYMRSVVQFNDILNVTTKDGSAVVMSKEDYDAMLETFYILSSPGMLDKVEAVENGKPEDFISLEEFIAMAEDEKCTE